MQKTILLAVGTIGAAVCGYFATPKIASLFGKTKNTTFGSPLRRTKMRSKRPFGHAQDLMSGNVDHEFQITQAG